MACQARRFLRPVGMDFRPERELRQIKAWAENGTNSLKCLSMKSVTSTMATKRSGPIASTRTMTTLQSATPRVCCHPPSATGMKSGKVSGLCTARSISVRSRLLSKCGDWFMAMTLVPPQLCGDASAMRQRIRRGGFSRPASLVLRVGSSKPTMGDGNAPALQATLASTSP